MVALLVGYRALQGATPPETATKTPIPQLPKPITMPTPPPRLRPAATEAMARLNGRRSGVCEVNIIGHGNAPPGAVVAILDGKSGAHLATQPLDNTRLPIQLRFPDIPDGEHWAVLARDLGELRFAYLGRTRLKPHPRMPGRRTATLRGQVYELLVQLKEPNSDVTWDCVPVLLRRPDDPDWHYRERGHEPQGQHQLKDLDEQWLLLTDQHGRIRLTQLGAGSYVLKADGFQRAGNAKEWQPLKMDQDRTLTIIGTAR